MSSQNLSSRLISSRLSSRLSSTSGHESDTGYLTAPESYSYDTSQLRIPPQYLTSRLSSGSSRLFSDNPQIPEYEVVPTAQAQQYLVPIQQQAPAAQAAPPAEYTNPLTASYYIKPPVIVDEPFPELIDLDNYDNSYLEGVRERFSQKYYKRNRPVKSRSRTVTTDDTCATGRL